jgi:hypothetical protein
MTLPTIPRCRGNVFTEPFPNNDRGIHRERERRQRKWGGSDTTFRGKNISGFEGSQAMLARPSDRGDVYDRK